MCVLAILYQTAHDAPILLASNREEFYDRASQAPRIQSGKPRIVCGTDRKAGGTWLGINQYGLLIAVTNRPRSSPPPDARSRGLLCRELLACRGAREAVDCAQRELSTGRYAGANYLCADGKFAGVVFGGPDLTISELEPGLHMLTGSGLNQYQDQRAQLIRRLLTLHKLDSSVTFLAVASRTFSRPPDPCGRHGVVVRDGDYGTVSSTLLALTSRASNAVYQYAPGPPSEVDYDDLSALLRQVLSAER